MPRRLILYTFIPVVLAAGYVAWTLWSRQHENDRLDRQRAIDEGKRAADVVQMYGGDELKILGFYASPAVIRGGEKALLCYGVNNAATVAIDPPVGEIAPSLSRCMEVRPSSTTTYNFTASDAHGRQLSQSVQLRVIHSRASSTPK